MVPDVLVEANASFQQAIKRDWPPERADVDSAYASYDWPFESLVAPGFALRADWPLSRLLAYFCSCSASKRHRERTGIDPVATYADAFAQAWGDPDRPRAVRWPLFVHARRKAGG